MSYYRRSRAACAKTIRLAMKRRAERQRQAAVAAAAADDTNNRERRDGEPV